MRMWSGEILGARICGEPLNFVTYDIEVVWQDDNDRRQVTTVTRRYREFEALQTQLVRVAQPVVPLPPKKLVGTLEVAFVEGRKKGLQTFINEVLGRKELASSLALQMFLVPLEVLIEREKEALRRAQSAPASPALGEPGCRARTTSEPLAADAATPRHRHRRCSRTGSSPAGGAAGAALQPPAEAGTCIRVPTPSPAPPAAPVEILVPAVAAAAPPASPPPAHRSPSAPPASTPQLGAASPPPPAQAGRRLSLVGSAAFPAAFLFAVLASLCIRLWGYAKSAAEAHSPLGKRGGARGGPAERPGPRRVLFAVPADDAGSGPERPAPPAAPSAEAEAGRLWARAEAVCGAAAGAGGSPGEVGAVQALEDEVEALRGRLPRGGEAARLAREAALMLAEAQADLLAPPSRPQRLLCAAFGCEAAVRAGCEGPAEAARRVWTAALALCSAAGALAVAALAPAAAQAAARAHAVLACGAALSALVRERAARLHPRAAAVPGRVWRRRAWAQLAAGALLLAVPLAGAAAGALEAFLLLSLLRAAAELLVALTHAALLAALAPGPPAPAPTLVPRNALVVAALAAELVLEAGTGLVLLARAAAAPFVLPPSAGGVWAAAALGALFSADAFCGLHALLSRLVALRGRLVLTGPQPALEPSAPS